ncbi:VOC family protein [Candidatus Cloacimonadota bacterium]
MKKNKQQPDKIEWLVIPSENLEKAAEFYSNIFNWKISVYTPEFWLFEADTVHGGFDKKLKPNDQGIRFSITVEDIPDKLTQIVDQGGLIIQEKYEIAKGFGFAASFKDPNGNIVELWASK